MCRHKHEEVHVVDNKQGAIYMEEWVLLGEETILRVASCRMIRENFFYQPNTGVVPTSLELWSISLPPSALKSATLPKESHFSVLYSFRELIFPILGKHFLCWEGRVTGEPTLQEMQAESAGLGQQSLCGPSSLM